MVVVLERFDRGRHPMRMRALPRFEAVVELLLVHLPSSRKNGSAACSRAQELIGASARSEIGATVSPKPPSSSQTNVEPPDP
jgi:hypothetical protein